MTNELTEEDMRDAFWDAWCVEKEAAVREGRPFSVEECLKVECRARRAVREEAV